MQMQLFRNELQATQQQIVNVASVPQRSPFRYPGGKTWLVPRIRDWLRERSPRPHLLVEPFAGGGIVSLTVAFEQLADHVLMVELDEQVGAVWQTIIGGDAVWLAEQIKTFDLTPETVQSELTVTPSTTRDMAWHTILKNRVSRGGILAPGAGVIRNGENGKGLRSRWYPETLARRIMDIHAIRDRITFVLGDGLEVMRQYAERTGTVTFIDPPYTAGGKGKRAGTRLYAYNELNHEVLFSLANAQAGDVLLTYDNDQEVQDLATRHGFVTTTIPMKNTHHTEMTELLIGRDLGWLGSQRVPVVE